MIDYSTWIGQKVIKKSGKPFKSTLKVATVKSVTTNPQDKKSRMAFTFYEDDSIVSAEQCKLLDKF